MAPRSARAAQRGQSVLELVLVLFHAKFHHLRAVARRLEALHAKGLLARTGACYRYDPRTKALRETVVRLAATYRERRVAVITVIASKPMENVRAFSDAFRLRKPQEEE